MQTQGLTTRLDGQDPSNTSAVAGRSSRGSAAGRLALIALLAGGAVGAAAGLSFDRPAATQVSRDPGPRTVSFSAAHAAKPSTAPQRAVDKPVRHSLMVLIPADRDYVASSSIAVAGLAFGRPRSPRVSAVEVELFVGGRLVDHVRLDVLSSRFAGVLKLSAPTGTTDAELRISDPTNQSGPAVVRQLTIDPPAAT
jgi:hypothetical protein